MSKKIIREQISEEVRRKDAYDASYYKGVYDAGYDKGVVSGIYIGTAFYAVAGLTGCAYIYKDQIKEYGKYVIGKFKKKKKRLISYN